MTAEATSSLLAALLVAAIGLAGVLSGHVTASFRKLAALCFNVSLFHILDFVNQVSGRPVLGLAALAAAAFLPATTGTFFRTFLHADEPRLARTGLLTALATALVVLLVAYATLNPSPVLMQVLPGLLLAHVALGLLVALAVMALRLRRATKAVERARLSYLLAGGAAATVGVVLGQALGGIPLALGRAIEVLYVYLLAQMIASARLLDVQEVMARLLNLAILALLVGGVFVLLTFWVPPESRELYFFNTLVASAAVIILIEPVRHLVEEKIARTLLRERMALTRRLDALVRRLERTLDLEELFATAVAGLEETLRVTRAAIYLRSPDETCFELRAWLGPRPPEKLDVAARRVFFRRLGMDKALVAETIRKALRVARAENQSGEAPEVRALEGVLETVEDLGADVCLPLSGEGAILGLLAVADDRMRQPFSERELQELERLADRLSVGILNSQHYEVMKSRDRLAALGEMAAGLAHEIRNPLGAMKGASQVLQEFLDSPPDTQREAEEIRALLEVITDEVERLDRVVSRFLAYARPAVVVREPVDVREVLTRTVRKATVSTRDVQIEWDLPGMLPPISADPTGLEQVFSNLVANAVQAMEGRGSLVISVRVEGQEEAGVLVVRFQDSGPGFPEDALGKVTRPFFTTKPDGTGLGLAICQRIVQAHGGELEVFNAPEGGAVAQVILPLAPA